nr:CBS domain-containing protein [Mycolicibacterium malmesburyense]CRL78537.1 signal-transduction protein [Mycolicibacterium malmesburyense]
MTESSPSPGSTPVSDVIGDPVARVPADATIAEAADAIISREVGAIAVGDDARPTALVSERDIVRAVAAGKDLSLPALEMASTKLVWCDAEATVNEVANQMMDRYIRHVLVERDGELVGIVSARDLLGIYGAGADLEIE